MILEKLLTKTTINPEISTLASLVHSLGIKCTMLLSLRMLWTFCSCVGWYSQGFHVVKLNYHLDYLLLPLVPPLLVRPVIFVLFHLVCYPIPRISSCLPLGWSLLLPFCVPGCLSLWGSSRCRGLCVTCTRK